MKVIRSTQTHRAVALAATAAVLSPSLVSTASATTPKVGPSTASFYAPAASKVKGGKHGDLIWYRTAQSALSATLPHAARVLNVVYKSQSLANKNIPVSGTVWVPAGTAPSGGWPVISWGHGTTGSADICAPSQLTAIDSPIGSYSSYVYPAFDKWLQAGYAVVMSDYEGLGTPGVHPYLVGPSEGRGMIDIVKAAHQLVPAIGTKWIASGHSQGGHSALFAANLAPTWGSGLSFKGVAAFAPANNLKSTVYIAKAAFTGPNGISGLGALIIRSINLVDKTRVLSDLMAPAPYALMSQIEQRCLGSEGGLGATDSFGQFSPAGLLRTWTGAKVANALNVLDGAQMNPNLTITKPIMLLQGLADGTVPSNTTDALNTQLRAKNPSLSITYNKYDGVGHGPVVDAGKSDAQAFFATQFAK